MADYNLTATQTGGQGGRKLRIKWSANLGYEATLTVHRGGDYKSVYSKSYSRSVKSDDITIDVPWYGQFKVELKLTSPAIGSQVIYPTVKMSGTSVLPTFVYDAAAVKKAQEGSAIVLLAQVLMGSIRLLGTAISIYFGTQSFMSDTVNFPNPKVGDKLDVTITATPSGGANVTTKFTQVAYTDKFGNSYSQQVYTKISAIAYVPYN